MRRVKYLVDATCLGMGKYIDEAPDFDYSLIGTDHICFDLVYNPGVTEFMRRCLKQGATERNGLAMLIGQAKQGWQFWKYCLDLGGIDIANRT